MHGSDRVEDLLRGDVRTLAKLISLVEDREPGFREAIDATYPHAADAYRIGITGPPGAGKSTLVDRLVPRFREEGFKVGILASDPTSPFSGGAVLGDRVRMHGLIDDEEVFIRSLATRGSLGGLSRIAFEASILLEAAGHRLIIYETVGVGQAEIDVVEAADSVVVVLTPQSGDAIQALKAGLTEIADLFVVNKADQEGADRAAEALRLALHRSHAQEGAFEAGDRGVWTPPIVQTVASDGEGIDDLKDALDGHHQFLGEAGLSAHRKARVTALVQGAVEEALRQELWDRRGQALLDEHCAEVLRGGSGPFQAADELLRALDQRN